MKPSELRQGKLDSSTFDNLSKEEQKTILQEQIHRAANVTRENFYKRFGKEVVFNKMKNLTELLGYGSQAVRFGLGETGKFTEDNFGLKLWNWDDPVNRVFRYQNQPSFRLMATYEHLVWEQIKDHVTSGKMLTTGFSPALAFTDIIGSHELLNKLAVEYKSGLPWAQANPEAVEAMTLATLDPMIGIGYVSDLFKMKFLTAEMKYAVPVVKRMMSAPNDTLKLLAASDLVGIEIINDSFLKMFNGMVKNGLRAEEIAMHFHTHGARAAPWATQSVVEMIPGSQYVRRAGSLVSSHIADFADKKAIYLDAIKHTWGNALSRVPKLTQYEADQVLALLKVPRQAYNKVGTWEANYMKLTEAERMHKGLPTLAELSPETFEKAKFVVNELNIGHRPGNAYIEAYGPAEWEIAKKQLANHATVDANKVARGWNLTREGKAALRMEAEDFRKWIAKVNVREFVGDKVDDLVAEAKRYKQTLRAMQTVAKRTGNLIKAKATNEQMKMVNHLIHDIKEFKGSSDFIKAMKGPDPKGFINIAISDILKAYDGATNIIRGLQLGVTPSWYWGNSLNSNLKNLVSTGEMDWKGMYSAFKENKTLYHLDPNGNVLDFSATPSELVFGELGVPTSRAGKFVKWLAEKQNTIESNVRNFTGKWHFNNNFERLIKAGVDWDAAIEQARRIAWKAVDSVHYNYGPEFRSAFDNFNRRVFMYPVFRGRDAAWGIEQIGKYPLEFYAAMKVEEQREGGSYDGKGSVVAGNRSVNPINNSIPGSNIMFDVLHPDRVLTPRQSHDYAVARGLSIVFGSYNPILQEGLKATGMLPDDQGTPIATSEKILGMLTKKLTDEDFYISDPFYNLIGKDPAEARESYLERRAKTIGTAFKLDNVDLDQETAQDLAERYRNEGDVSSFLTGFRVEPATPGIRRLTKELIVANQGVADSPEHLQQARKMVETAYNPDPLLDRSYLGPLMIKTNEERFSIEMNNIDNKEKEDSGYMRTFNQDKETFLKDQDKQEKFKDIQEFLEKSPKFNIFKSIFGATPAEAGTIRSNEENISLPPGQYRVSFNEQTGAATFNPIKEKPSAAEKAESARITNYFNSTFSNDLKKTGGVKETFDLIKSHEMPDGRNLFKDMLDAASGDARFAPYKQAYDWQNSGGKEGSFTIAPPQHIAYRTSFSKDFADKVLHSGNDAEKWASMPLSQIHDAISSGKFKLTGNLPIGAVDDAALEVARQNLPENYAYKAAHEKQSKDDLQYPGNGIWRQRLNEDILHRKEDVMETVNAINGYIKNPGTTPETMISPSFFASLSNSALKENRHLFEQSSIMYNHDRIKQVADSIYRFNPYTKKVELNWSRIGEFVEHGSSPELAAIRQGYAGPNVASAFNDPSLPKEVALWRDTNIPTSPQYLAETFLHDFQIATNVPSNPLYEALLSSGTITEDRKQAYDPLDIETKVMPTASRDSSGMPTVSFDSSGNVQSVTNIEPRDSRYQLPALNSSDAAIANVGPMARMSQPRVGTSGTAQGLSFSKDFSMQQGLSEWTPREGPQMNPPTRMGIINGTIFAVNAHNANVQYAQENNLPEPGFLTDAQQMFTQQNGQPTMNGVQQAQAVHSLARVAGALGAYERGSETDSAVGGLGMGLTSGIALALLGAGPAGWVAAAGIGIAYGLKEAGVWGDGKSSRDQEFRDMEIAREQAQRNRIRIQNDLRQLSVREQNLSLAFQGGSRVNRQNVAPQVEEFRRRPTFQSRIGLVDALERELSSALKPRW